MTEQDFMRLWLDGRIPPPRAIVESPAFRMAVATPSGAGFLTWDAPGVPAAGDACPLLLGLQDGVEQILLGLQDLQAFPRLEKALRLEPAVPDDLLLAVAEAEFSQYAPWMGESVRIERIHRGLPDDRPDHLRAFTVRDEEGKALQTGVLTLTTALEERWGTLKNLDIGAYFSLEDAPLDAAPVYAGFRLDPERTAALKPGDRLLLPEWNPAERHADCLLVADHRLAAKAARQDGALAAAAPWQPFRAEPGELLIAGEAVPLSPRQAMELLGGEGRLSLELPSPDRLRLVRDRQAIADGRLGVLGGQGCMEITCAAQA